VIKALAEYFAKGAHAGQKHGNRPYTVHLQDVINALVGWGWGTDDLVCAALLHDTIEDTSVTYQDLKTAFNQNVADLVWAVTDEMGRNRKERKEKTWPKISASGEAVILKLADLYSNVFRSAADKSDQLQMYKKEWPETKALFYEALKAHNNVALVHVLDRIESMLTD
jgi:(p)ppGpp synthase/HD superfamily hydrolase